MKQEKEALKVQEPKSDSDIFHKSISPFLFKLLIVNIWW